MGQMICENCGQRFEWKTRQKDFGLAEEVYGCNVVDTEEDKEGKRLIVTVRCDYCGHIQSSRQILEIK